MSNRKRYAKKTSVVEARIADDQNVLLESLARARGVSKSKLLREAVALLLATVTYKTNTQGALDLLSELRDKLPPA